MRSAWEIISAIGMLVVFFAMAGWVGWRLIRKAEDPSWLIVKFVISSIIAITGFIFALSMKEFAPLVAVAFFVPIGLWWAPQFGAAFARPLTSMFDGGDQEVELKPLYSIVKAQVAKGDLRRAQEELRKQLEKFPGDYEGMMLLAEIQAEKLMDVRSAAITISRIESNTKATPANVADALHRLADWHMEFNVDPEAAKTVLERLAGLFPGSIQAQLALERIARLPSADQLLEAKDRKSIVLKSGAKNVGVKPSPIDLSPENFEQQASILVKKLENFPEDSEAREALASIYSSHYKRLDLAEEQFRLLINQPGHTQKQVVRWLNRLADLNVAHSRLESAREVLKEISVRYPQTAAAEQAEARLMVVEREAHSGDAPQILKLGSYKKNLGLEKNG